ncbi:NusA-like transcription termination signal-binding factor [Picrophilus oshimae]|uniref:Probable transcription termination protein NusA n=1 Tax=Picrophilus torridus (strain ATCC 700027 / DSM 9790 / JCM 10055 / NBRC 100828 / KAW 2/3) TaxID=1122961 RepID=Q6L2G1_PICTO|nr:NusA-like transcription termination signal-binding factor [Picrophilus oshimae]AAT42841.1 NusA-like protein [Picrophilus oshimae DSM 9789]SMD31601.1 N utilization substance protein A [Picrophilus oshimae DSM 9789]
MNEITIDNKTLENIKLFESYAKTRVYECLENEEMILFVVGERKLAEIFKRNPDIISALKEKINKRILLAEYSSDLLTFVKNLFFKYEIREIEIYWKENQTTIYLTIAPENIGRAIGKDSRNIKLMKDAVSRYFHIKSIIIRQK